MYRSAVRQFALAILFLTIAPSACGQTEQATAVDASRHRTVSDPDRGSIFTTPVNQRWDELGAYVGVHNSTNWARMSSEAVKIVHGRFHLVKPSDDTTWAWFPYTRFQEFERQEIAAGRPPLLVTHTSNGRTRPVYWLWSLGVTADGRVTAPENNWQQAVHVSDPRYVRFWVDEYARPILLSRFGQSRNVWIGVDEGAFNLNLYGIVDDNKRFVPLASWDSPFPATEEEYLGSIDSFFQQLKEYAPDIRVMVNIGSLRDWNRFPEVFRNIPGIMLEEVLEYDTSSYVRGQKILPIFKALEWAATQGKVAVLRTVVPDDPVRARTAYAAYSLVRGPNSFYAPQLIRSVNELPPDRYSDFANAIGKPMGPLQSAADPSGINEGYRLYWRDMEGGRVYLNWTGRRQRVSLPRDSTFYDRNGAPVFEIELDDMTGDYVTFEPGRRCAPPSISPRLAAASAVPVQVAVRGAEFASSTVVQETTEITAGADSCANGRLPSFKQTARFVIDPTTPTVSFVGPESLDVGPGRHYVLLALDRVTDTPTVVHYGLSTSNSSEPETIGEITIPAWERYASVEVPVSRLMSQATGAVFHIRLLSCRTCTISEGVGQVRRSLAQ